MDSQVKKLTPELNIRRSPYLVMHFDRKGLMIENYFTKRGFRGTPSTLELLNIFDRWATASVASSKLKDYSKISILRSIQNLLNHGLLITEESEQNKLETKFGKQWQWPLESRYYHFSTKIDRPFPTRTQVRKYYEKYLRGKKQPSIYKTYPGHPKVTLSTPSKSNVSLFETLCSRRTVREFTGQPVTLKQLSNILHYTWGSVSTYDTVEFGELLDRTSPSAGADTQ